MLGQRMYSWRWPLWPVTLAILVACVVSGVCIYNGIVDPAVGTVASAVTIVWLVLGQFIGPRLEARMSKVSNSEA